MHQQGMITQEEYDQAMQESAAMTFVGYTDDNVVDNVPIDDWYVEAMLNDVAEDLAEALNVDEDNAMYMLMHNGYNDLFRHGCGDPENGGGGAVHSGADASR